jgi:hypothetical protein
MKQIALVIFILAAGTMPAVAQQKGQYIPGQFGLNAGVLPADGFTYSEMALNYSARSLKDQDGHSLPITGTYDVWAIENIFYFVAPAKVLGGKFAFMVIAPTANGSVTLPRFDLTSDTGYAMSDTWIQPATLGWHFDRADATAAYAFVAPTGRYTRGGTDNVGSGYWGNHVNGATTVYLTSNKATTANVFGNWEAHGTRKDTQIVPGQAVTLEWGLGQSIPLDSDEHKLIQLGLIGYDQWRVSDDSGTFADGTSASLIPRYAVHAIGFQGNFVVPSLGLNFYAKFEPEYRAVSRPKGRTVVFGGSFTVPYPKGSTTP